MPVACKIQEFRENILFLKIGVAQLLAVPGVADRFQYSGYHNAEVGDGISLRLYTFPGPVSFFVKWVRKSSYRLSLMQNWAKEGRFSFCRKLMLCI